MEASLKEAQELMTTILKDIDSICRKNNINYWIESGTLLGAVRHKGFIPWDDDIDIGMLREDYNKFLEIANKELKDDVILCNFKNEKNVQYQWSKVKHKYSEIIEDGNTSEKSGLFVDIFPYDFYSREGNDFASKLKKRYKKKFAVLHYSSLDNKTINNSSDKVKKYKSKILKIFLNKTFNELCSDVVKEITVKERNKEDVLPSIFSPYYHKIFRCKTRCHRKHSRLPYNEPAFVLLLVSFPAFSHEALPKMQEQRKLPALK